MLTDYNHKAHPLPHLAMLLEDRRSHISELHTVTVKTEELQQLTYSKIYHEISSDTLGDMVLKMSKEIVYLYSKIEEREAKMQILREIGERSQRNKKVKKQYEGRVMMEIIRENKAIGKMLKFAHNCNLKTVTLQYLEKYVKTLVSEGGPNEAATHLSNFLRFLREYQSDSVYQRMLSLSAELQDGINQHLSMALQSYQNQCDLHGEKVNQNFQEIDRNRMEMKIDLQILENQIFDMRKTLFEGCNENQCNFQNSSEKEIIQYLLSSHRSLLTQMESYITIVQQSYENQCHIPAMEQSQKLQESRTELKDLLQESIRNVFESTCNNIRELQKNKMRSTQLQRRINELNGTIVDIHRSMRKIDKENEGENRNGIALPVTTRRNKNQERELSVSIRYSRKSMEFHVLRTMHIGDFTAQGQKNYSRSKVKEEKFKQRVVIFGKRKIILKKEHPHFHEQIQIKRITKMKVINKQTLHMYFKKGYMVLEFTNPEQSARQWVRCFKAAFYDEQHTNSIEFTQMPTNSLTSRSNKSQTKSRQVLGSLFKNSPLQTQCTSKIFTKPRPSISRQSLAL